MFDSLPSISILQSEFFWWEPVFMIQRLSIVGFVQLIPPDLKFLRLLIGLMMTLAYMTLLTIVRPYRLWDLNMLAIATQITLTCVFIAAICISLYTRLEERGISIGEGAEDLAQDILGFPSAYAVVNVMLFLTFGVLGLFASLVVYQAMALRTSDSVRIVGTRTPPDLTLVLNCRWHTFVSHIWSTGQDRKPMLRAEPRPPPHPPPRSARRPELHPELVLTE